VTTTVGNTTGALVLLADSCATTEAESRVRSERWEVSRRFEDARPLNTEH
jgi:hypothetical protein